MDLQQVKEEIEAKLGIRLTAEECVEEKLRKLRRLCKEPPVLTLVSTAIPLNPLRANLEDPRVASPVYRNAFYQRKNEGRGRVEINIPPLQVILDLDHTLVECIMPPSPYQKPQVEDYKATILKEFPQAQVKLLVTRQEDNNIYLLYTVRQGADSLLRKLKKYAELTLFTRGQENYVNDLLQQEQWREHFSRVVCVPEDRKSIRAHLTIPSRDHVVIVDDQLRVWVEEDQPYVVPVSRYMPLFKFDRKFTENPRASQQFLAFSFAIELPDLKESSEAEARKSFLDGFDSRQMEGLQRRLRDVHERSFIRSETAIQSFKALMEKELQGKSYQLNFPRGAEERERIIHSVLRALGARVETSAEARPLTLARAESWGTPSPFSDIFKVYFKSTSTTQSNQ